MDKGLFAILLAQLCLMAWRDYQWRLERQDYINRLATGQIIPAGEIKEKPPPRGGNMVRAGLKKAADRQYEQLKAGDV